MTQPGVTQPGQPAQEIDFTVRGKNFQPGSNVLIAQYKPAGGWTYLASLQAREATANQLTVHYAGLPANEYWVIVESPDGRMSRPAQFLIATDGYKLPTAAGVPWIITQGPYGTFSHWGNSLHAFDIAPRAGNCVVAMKAGIAYTHDLGLQQDHRHHSFGNYITIDHGNGEFSHYAHLATGTFVVRNGEHVEQGQALATAGNSGYTLGEGGGYHVHVSVTRELPISSWSVPFQFEDLPDWSRGGGYRTVVSSNASPLCDCGSRRTVAGGGAPAGAATMRSPAEEQFSGSVSVEQWWSEVIAVSGKSKVLEVALSWSGTPGDLDLHLMSPSGRHYAAYADTTGYSGETNPKSFRVPNPEPGLWRISVEGMRGPGPINFGVETSGSKAALTCVAVTFIKSSERCSKMATMRRSALLLVVLAVVFAQSGYHLIKKIPVPGDGFWDYLTTDPATGRIFVSHGSQVDVVDGKKGEVTGTITGLKLVHGIAIVREFNRGFISDGGANQVVVFDLTTLQKVGEVAAGMNPDGIIYDPASKRVFAFNGRGASATAVDAEKGTLAGTVTLEGKPEFPAPDDKGHVYVNIEDKSEVMEIDSKALKVLNKWPLAPCEEPSGMAMDTKTRRIFSGCDNKIMSVMDADTGKVVATVPIGAGVDATWFDPETKYVFEFLRAGRRPHGHPRRFSRQIYRGRKREDGSGRANHGPGS